MSKGQTAVEEAASKGHEAAVQLLLEKRTNIDEKGPRSMTALRLVTYRRQEAVVRVLLNCGADVSLRDEDGWTALHGAASKGYKVIAQLLLDPDIGSEVNTKDNGGLSALHRDASEGHEALVLLLLARGADSMAKTKNGEMPDQLAAQCGQTAVFNHYINELLDYYTALSYVWGIRRTSKDLLWIATPCKPENGSPVHKRQNWDIENVGGHYQHQLKGYRRAISST